MGTQFSVWLPAHAGPTVTEPARRPAAEPAAAVSARAPVSRILYVDDDESMAFLVRRFLERSGYRVLTCDSPVEALTALDDEADRFDLCITDHNMPGMSGLDLVAAMRAAGHRVPVVIASGYISDELRHRSAQIGVSELLHKPDTVEELCASIERVLHAAHEAAELRGAPTPPGG